MAHSLRVRWTLVPRTAPQPWLSCSRCGTATAFRSSGRFRVNANGRRLDAWLIYRCTACDTTWNRPLLERRSVESVAPSLLDALRANDPELARQVAFDTADLRRRTSRIEGATEVAVRKQLLSAGPDPIQRLHITLTVPASTRLRLDRLLAAEFGIARKRPRDLQKTGRLTVSPSGIRSLRRPVQDGTVLDLTLAQDSESGRIAQAAVGAVGAP